MVTAAFVVGVVVESQVDGAIAVRSARKQRLDEPDPLHLHAILDEAAISRQVGGHAVMLEQLNHLLAMSKRSTITVQVTPFAAGAYGLSAGASLLRWPEQRLRRARARNADSLEGHQKPDVKATFTTNYAMKVAFTSSQSLRT
ncbi:MAG: putative DNA-binding protein [Amycolatopsis sp.]|nr:Scr1 family TA system antitoxin-like transcriptional regulator [Amycolatopsis sp.]MCU1684994.1 putative DNA-binding protein [Amycolatopsis sp.]